MKKISSKMKILLVMAICAAMMVPSMAFANQTIGPGWSRTLHPGELILDWTGNGSNLNTINFKVDNGSNGDNRVSSVKVTLLDDNGKVKVVIISPNKFNQDIASGSGVLNRATLDGILNPKICIKVNGKKSNFIKLTVGKSFPFQKPRPSFP